MRYLVIGLGIYGANLARDLIAQGHEVIGVDASRANIDAIKDYITTAYVLDTTEETALGVLPIRNVDVVIVAIGENFGASVKTVALLKKAGVKKIFARAIDELHESILQSFAVDRILCPEQRAALDLTHEMALGTDVETLQVAPDVYIMKLRVPKFFEGLAYSELNFEKQYGLRIVAVTRLSDKTSLLGVTHKLPQPFDYTAEGTTVEPGDAITLYGTIKALRDLYRHIDG